MLRTLCTSLLALVTLTGYAWNAMGHKLVAQIAYDNLTPEAKALCKRYGSAATISKSKSGFVKASTWMDVIRRKDIHWYDNLHYIDTPFTTDDVPLPPLQKINAVWGIKQALIVLSSSKSNDMDKGMSLRILTHLVGDIHQPLHTVTRISKELPKGDLGGNLFHLAKNPIGSNLHQYWDNGGGVLIGPSKKFQVENKARHLEKKWSCATVNTESRPGDWVKAANRIAISQVYTLSPQQIPSKHYQLNAQNITEKQILLAGCRLAALINTIEKQTK